MAVLFDLAAREGRLAGEGITFARALEQAISTQIKPIPLNIDGALAAILVDMGFPSAVGQAALHHRPCRRDQRRSAGRAHARKADAHQECPSSTMARLRKPDRSKSAMAVAVSGGRELTAEESRWRRRSSSERATRWRAVVATIRPPSIVCVPGRRVGRRQRADRDPARQHERGRVRHGQPRAEAPRQGPGHPARRAAPEEHGRSSKRFPRRASSSMPSRPA